MYIPVVKMGRSTLEKMSLHLKKHFMTCHQQLYEKLLYEYGVDIFHRSLIFKQTFEHYIYYFNISNTSGYLFGINLICMYILSQNREKYTGITVSAS